MAVYVSSKAANTLDWKVDGNTGPAVYGANGGNFVYRATWLGILEGPGIYAVLTLFDAQVVVVGLGMLLRIILVANVRRCAMLEI